MALPDLTTLANVRQYLGLQASATNDDALLGRLITAASAWVRQYLNRDLTSTTYTETYDGTRSGNIVLAQYPVTAVTSVLVGPPGTTRVALSEAAGDFVWEASGLLTDLSGSITKGAARVVVTYTAGYDTVPGDLEDAVIQIVAWRYKERDRIGQSSKSIGGQETVAFQTTDVPAAVKTSLANWRRVAPF